MASYLAVLRAAHVELCESLVKLMRLQNNRPSLAKGVEVSLKYISVMDLCGGDASKEETIAKAAERGLKPLPMSVLPTALIHFKQYWDKRYMPDTILVPCTSGPTSVLRTNYLVCARERNQALSVRFLDPLVDGKWRANDYVVFCRLL